ncbi:unnamed protein product, partial [Medioppia subpectinata]
KNYGYVNHSILNEHTLRLNHIQNQLNQISKIAEFSPQKAVQSVDTTRREYSSDSDSDFTADSGNSSDESEISDISFETCSTVDVVVSSSTTKANDNNEMRVENNENLVAVNSPELTISPRSYNLRPRKSITYTKSGIITETVDDFVATVQLSECISKANSQITHTNAKNFLSSDED